MAEEMVEIAWGTLDKTPLVAEQLFDRLKGKAKVCLFYGQMGAGKTTLIKALCEIWGVEDNVSSPTFALVNEYQNQKGQVFYHFDFYRIEDEEEAWDIGTEDYFYSGNYCLVEWPERIEGLLPRQHVRIELIVAADHSRRIHITYHE